MMSIENVAQNMLTDLQAHAPIEVPTVIVDLQMEQVAYKAAFAATARVLQPSLLDFLR